MTDTGNVVIRDGDEVVGDVPAALFTDECPTYVREAAEDPAIIAARTSDLARYPDIAPDEVAATTMELLGSANIGSRRPVYRRYDSTIMTNTVVGPGPSDAAVLRIKGQETGLAISLDCNSRYCYLDPDRGAQLPWPKRAATSAALAGEPLAITNCLNFRNPEKPAGYFQLQPRDRRDGGCLPGARRGRRQWQRLALQRVSRRSDLPDADHRVRRSRG